MNGDFVTLNHTKIIHWNDKQEKYYIYIAWRRMQSQQTQEHSFTEVNITLINYSYDVMVNISGGYFMRIKLRFLFFMCEIFQVE